MCRRGCSWPGFPSSQRLAEELGFFFFDVRFLDGDWHARVLVLQFDSREDQEARAAWRMPSAGSQALQGADVEAQLTALQAQIEPHFLFNTLANVKRLYETAPTRDAKCWQA